MENNNTIIFRMGEETGIVIEKTKDQFEHSLFKEQYKQAFSIMDSIISRTTKVRPDDEIDENISNIIAFCGDRGEGKTSALETVRGILLHKERFKAAVSANLFDKDTQLDANKFKVLNLVDPAFFDKEHNLIELLLGQMYAEILCDDKQKAQNGECEDFCTSRNVALRNNLMQSFEEVRHSLDIIHKASEKNAYDNLEQVDDLAAGIVLKKKICCLLMNYAQYFQKERVLICVDDLDLNVSDGYQMAEEIRKYLSLPSACIVMMAIKVEQMVEVVQSYLRDNTSKIIPNETITDMANRYVTKMLPQTHQVQMPRGEEIAERPLKLDWEPEKKVYPLVKEVVVNTIYRKTRFIFVNGRNLSPIVPTNLRTLRYLLSLLWSLPDCLPGDMNHNRNKIAFENYFYYTWTKVLNQNDIKFIAELATSEDLVSINKSVLMHLRTNLLKMLNDDKYEFKGTLGKILNPMNTMQNVSLGDVFYVLNHIDNTATTIEEKNLVFFLRAFYSIRLYGAYDIISMSRSQLFVEGEDEQLSIYKYDEELRHLNKLQRLVNGAYFTYEPGVLLPAERYFGPRDKRLIDGKSLQALFKSVKNIENEEERIKALKLAEFFALTVCFPSYANNENVDYDRTLSRRSYYASFSTSNNFIAFDVMSVFFNLINVRFTYQRWNKIFKDDFYEYTKSQPKSLLNLILKECENEHPTTDTDLDSNLHSLISDVAIRFSEVQLAILDHVMNSRNIQKEGGNTNVLQNLYNAIQNIGIKLYPIKEGETEYPLQFHFLTPIISLLDEVDTTKFDEIFSTSKDIKQSELFDAFDLVLKGLNFPTTGKGVQNYIKQTWPEWYKNSGGYQYWRGLLKDKIVYNDVKDIVMALIRENTNSSVLDDYLKLLQLQK